MWGWGEELWVRLCHFLAGWTCQSAGDWSCWADCILPPLQHCQGRCLRQRPGNSHSELRRNEWEWQNCSAWHWFPHRHSELFTIMQVISSLSGENGSSALLCKRSAVGCAEVFCKWVLNLARLQDKFIFKTDCAQPALNLFFLSSLLFLFCWTSPLWWRYWKVWWWSCRTVLCPCSEVAKTSFFLYLQDAAVEFLHLWVSVAGRESGRRKY